MNRIIACAPLSLCLFVMACGARPPSPPTVEFPQIPDLSAETVKACPEVPEVLSYAGLIAADAALAFEYGKCRARAATAVGAYQDAQRLLREAEAKAKGLDGPAAWKEPQ